MIPCDCSTKWLKELELTGVEVITATRPCLTPADLADASWNSLMPEDFGTGCTGRHYKFHFIRSHMLDVIFSELVSIN